jgi:ribosome biogenesis protein MAK21
MFLKLKISLESVLCSVSVFVINSIFLLPGEVIKYPGDPLQDFTLPKFLDRFVFKNPKKKNDEEVVINSKFSRKKTYVPSGIRALRVDSSSYLNEDESKIPVDELFLYRLVFSFWTVSFIMITPCTVKS